MRAADVAERLDIPANQASFHLRQLAKYGLVEEAPELARDGRDRVWRATSRERAERQPRGAGRAGRRQGGRRGVPQAVDGRRPRGDRPRRPAGAAEGRHGRGQPARALRLTKADAKKLAERAQRPGRGVADEGPERHERPAPTRCSGCSQPAPGRRVLGWRGARPPASRAAGGGGRGAGGLAAHRRADAAAGQALPGGAGAPGRPGVRSRCGCRRTPRCRPSRASGTPGARRRRSSRPTPRPGWRWPSGALTWADAERAGRLRASGERADLTPYLPLTEDA